MRYVTTPAVALALFTAPAAGQLRPLDPFEWRLYDGGPAAVVEIGAAAYDDQPASLAGSAGTLLEVGSFRAFWRTGRVVFEAAGTVQRFFREERTFAAPASFVEPAADGHRRDSGDYLVSSTVRLTPAASRAAAYVRFGARLPTTDNRTGLERDMTDFFALVGGRVTRGPLLVGAETGVSINGTRDPEFEQKDVMPYLLRVEYGLGPVVPGLTATGDVLGPSRELRGNEPLGELRMGLRSTGRQWLRVEAVAGYRTYSPRAGIRVTGGIDW
ncbi:MAG TPA: hypothetical protein VK929_04610 [Longimicrobiales bacterium]|nr:hypothetical protein [Longimicrobiales bacterium]